MVKFRRMKNYFLLLATVLMITSCANSETGEEPADASINSELYVQMGAGFRVAESYCISCHAWDPDLENKVAPSFSEIKRSYLDEVSDYDEFNLKIQQFLALPGKENALMKHSVEQYGVMPKFDISEQEATDFATYLYHSPLDKPDWYSKYYVLDKENFASSNTDVSYIDLGKKHALSTKAILGKNLKGTIKNKGTLEAIGFCNAKAYPLTDSMSVVLNTKIKRVSDQPRNPKNTANDRELAYIKNAKLTLSKGNKVKPQMEELNGKMIGYYPITTNAMCMQCHGDPTNQIKPEVLKSIKHLYPNDLATGYGENELRGIWVVQMDSKN